MHVDDYKAQDGLGLARLVRTRQVSAEEVLAAARAVIEAENLTINAVIEAFDAQLAATSGTEPFLGVPFLVKDVGTSVQGIRYQCGSRLGARSAPSPHDSALARRWRRAGLRIMGRTTTPEVAFNITTENRLHGPTRNPWNLAHSAGGSSGGAAAAVAAGMVPLAEANDGGGSIRIPAACCGLVGLKPSRGRISMAPDAGEYLCGLSVSHVVSRSLRDSAAMLDATAGPEPGDPYPPLPITESYLKALARDPAPLRIALMITPWNGGKVHPACADAAKDTARLLESLGHYVTEAVLPLGASWDAFIEANARIWCANITPWLDALAAETGRSVAPDAVEATTWACYQYGQSLSAAQLLEALQIVNTVSRHAGAFFEEYDILLTPTLPQPPHRLGVFNADAPGLSALDWAGQIFAGSPYTPLANVTGQPAISLPLATAADNLPIGMQFMAGMGREDLLFSLSGQIERARPWSQACPS
jgi:amidase